MSRTPEIYPTSSDLVRASAERISSLLDAAVRANGTATLALSGGSTPRSVYALLGSEPYRSQIPWDKVHLFWGDERCVPADHAESNYRMVKESLFNHITIPAANIHRIMAERGAAIAAQDYEVEIMHVFGLSAGSMPVFDVILLGLGEDGHTASLFPGTAALEEKGRIVTDVFVQKLNTERITLSFPAINNAAHIIFLVSGAGKAPILAEVLHGPHKYPSQRIQPQNGEVIWLVDRDASTQLMTVNPQ